MAQGIMTPFCLIINSYGLWVPHVPADAARQAGSAREGAKQRWAIRTNPFLLLLTEVVP